MSKKHKHRKHGRKRTPRLNKKYIYTFKEGKADMRILLGGKGANLAEMTNLSLPVPPGFTLTTELCKSYYANGKRYPAGLEEEMLKYIEKVETQTGKKFGDAKNPLLVSVRSGAPASMPGMMDTVLNLGLNDKTIKGVIEQTKNERFAYDCYRRFIQMFGNVVLGMEHEDFEEIIEAQKKQARVKLDTEISVEGWKNVIIEYKKLIKKVTGKDFPQDPVEQLKLSRDAVFSSWNNQRAIVYRRLNKIPSSWGTAVNVQTMVFGNRGDDCATGVVFTRDPSNGKKGLYGEFLQNAQGEDVVAGIRTPHPIQHLKALMPKPYKQLVAICDLLEKHYKDVQDMEFTIEKGKFYMLQTRNGKRTAAAALKIAVDMAREKMITREEALLRVDPKELDKILHKHIDPKAKVNVLAKGLPASPGAVSGQVVFDADDAEEWTDDGKKVILVRIETIPDDVHGIYAAEGTLTSRGGMTSHAAVVARGMGKPCVAGCDDLKIDLKAKKFQVGDVTIKQGDVVTIDGSTGSLILGKVSMVEPDLSGDFHTLLRWADDVRRLRVRANADTPDMAKKGRLFGGEGIGLCRTERMFLAQDRLPVVQDMILAETSADRNKAIKKLEPMQRKDFREIFEAMDGLPVNIRLLDLPLHEFLPRFDELLEEVTYLKAKGKTGPKYREAEKLMNKVRALTEVNPMIGHRGCRVGIVYPELYQMQIRAIFDSACELVKKGYKVKPEIMVPLISSESEIKLLSEMIKTEADEIIKKHKVRLKYQVGTMIELPKACVTADEIARHADYFSFGTNDLTQTAFGFSREDVEAKFLPAYIEQNLLPDNPFAVLDQKGVGSLVRIGVEKGRETKPNLKTGICGEHGGEPSSVEFCHKIGLTYVSCSPYRIPIARLAAAQAQIKQFRK